MKILKIFTIFTSLLLCTLSLNAQQIAKYTEASLVPIKSASGRLEKIKLSVDIDVTATSLKSQQMLQITPQIVSADRQHVKELPMIIVAGNTRYKALQRQAFYSNLNDFNPKTKIVRFKDVNGSKINYEYILPFESWMKKSDAMVTEEITGCASCIKPQIVGQTGLTPISITTLKMEPYRPSFAVSYIAPEVEKRKERSDKIEAFFNYKQARYELLKDYKNNASELRRVDNFINTFVGDANITVSDYVIEGYASPEGTFQSNKTLSLNRAKTFASYLKVKYNIKNNQMRVNGYGEDWDGLRKAVSESTLSNKEQILSIIDRYQTDVEREKDIKKLDNGVTYNKLLNELYPPLRRNTLSLSYIVKGFSLDEALEVYKTKPQQLSLEEFFRVSETFQKGGSDFIEVFKTAIRYYPENEIANLNTGAAYLESGNYQAAMPYLEKSGNSPEALSNKGIVYFNRGEYDKCRRAFEESIRKGYQAAKINLEELEKFEKSVQ